jgi:predicted metal-dependent hydrolase
MIPVETGFLSVGAAHAPDTVRRSAKRRRTVAFYIESGGAVRILAPARMGDAALYALLRQKEKWIAGRLEQQRRAESIGQNDTVFYRGVSLPLDVTNDAARPSGCILKENRVEINVALPEPSHAALRAEARTELALWQKREARREFRGRLDHWAEGLGVKYRRLIVADQARRWGSCNARNDIRLNWRLIMLPPDLLDYVAAHELCDVRH